MDAPNVDTSGRGPSATSLISVQISGPRVFDKIYNIDISRSALLLDIITLYRGLRHFFHAKENMPLTDIVSVDEALQYRSVSVPTDEAILIGGLLNLDLGYILDGPAESRMQRVWSLVSSAPGGIPKNILFNRGPRLRQTGYRWAPESLLSSRGTNEENLRSHEAYNTGCLTSTGLNVHVSAFSTAIMGSAPRGVPKNPWGVFNNRDENSILCRHDGGIWFFMVVKYSQADREEVDRDASSRPASLRTFLKDVSQTRRLLLASAFKFEATLESSAALLVHDATGPHPIGPTQVVSDMIVGIWKQEHINQNLLEAAYQASQSLLDDEVTAHYADLAVDDEEEQRRNHAYANLQVQLGTRITALAESIDIDDNMSVISGQEVQHSKLLAGALITSFYLGEYCVLGPILSSETEWCVD
ncbi:MAG: hypothetical protein L6R42_000491 [Xanthoria sp. 1 TBL-2021]|nr:MAG: hypothetical protein L6R42_000491 [Xanthoria sp. 1 TBL-2021]